MGSGEEVEEVKEYLGGPIKIKITAKENFILVFLNSRGVYQLISEYASKNISLRLK